MNIGTGAGGNELSNMESTVRIGGNRDKQRENSERRH
jgi:hypothetical protein